MSMTPVDDELVGNEILNQYEWKSRQCADLVILLFSRSTKQKEKPSITPISTVEGISFRSLIIFL
jgi:hypothetical protein